MAAFLAESGSWWTYITEYFGIESALNLFTIILDIMIVAFLAYQVLKLFKGTRASALVRSLILILVMTLLARVLNLRVVSSILNVILNVLPVLAVVLFAPEIRKMLEALGGRKAGDAIASIFKLKKTDEQKKIEMHRIIGETVTAVSSMAKTKTGALIVFERKNSIAEWDAQGTKLDAVVSARLLEQIFVKNTPLHDAAVLIRDGRIYAAQCVLPNTKNKDLSRELGTRHMAAIGASEEADCIVVVVSEETGIISCAKAGQIIRNLDSTTLRTFLVDELVPEDRESDSKNGKTNFFAKLFKKKKGDGNGVS
ncbi:MAG: diadenylate cyclase CdaA [Clostridia bacterium]|nr:diadenylate cyclase CdaA [Clostridia bacterium]